MAQTIKVLNTVQALGADAVISDGNLIIAGVIIPLDGIKPGSARKPYVAEVLQITTGDPTATASTSYSFNVLAHSTIDDRMKTFAVPAFTSSSSTSKTAISTVVVNTLNQFGDASFTTALGGSAPNQTVVVTAKAGFPIFTAQGGSSTPGVFTMTATQAGVVGRGSGASILLSNESHEDIVSTNNYSTYLIEYSDPAIVKTRNEEFPSTNQLLLYVNEGATNFASLSGTYGTLTLALQGYQATHDAAPVGSTPTLAYTSATGALALAGAGNTWQANNIQQGDVVYITAAPTVLYPVDIQTSGTAGLSDTAISADAAAAAYSIIRIRKV